MSVFCTAFEKFGIVREQMSARDKGDGTPRFEALPDPYEGLSEETITKRASDPVNSPSHYTSGGIETIDAIEAWGLDRDFCLANAVKYISRAGKKDPAKTLEDLKKARWYLNRRIVKLEMAKLEKK